MKMTTVAWTQMSVRLVEQLLFLRGFLFQDCKNLNPSAQVVMQVDVQKKLNSQMQIVVGSQESSC